ncbi:MAG: hypothetical protein ACREAX_03810 [Candidatus Nitrosotenuis sp.]
MTELGRISNSKIKKLIPQRIDVVVKTQKDSHFVVLTPRIFRIYQKYGKTKCVSCNLELRVFDTVYNSSTRKPYHILCALTMKLIVYR